MINYLEKISGKKILVTGGLGFVGHNLVKTLLNTYKCEVIVVDNCANSSPNVLGTDIDKVQFYNISVLDTIQLFPLLHEVNFIFHLACKQISASGKEALDDMKVNAESTLNILEYIKNNSLPLLERFVYTSSCSVYGSSTKLPASESDPTFVLSNYAATKLLGENYTLIYNKNYDLPTASVRYSNVYGYGQSPRNPYCGVLGKFVHNALVQQPLSVFGDGEQTRDFTFVDNAVQINVKGMLTQNTAALNKVYNVAVGENFSVNYLYKICREALQSNWEATYREPRAGDIRNSLADITLANDLLGYAPTKKFEDGLLETISFFKTLYSNGK